MTKSSARNGNLQQTVVECGHSVAVISAHFSSIPTIFSTTSPLLQSVNFTLVFFALIILITSAVTLINQGYRAEWSFNSQLVILITRAAGGDFRGLEL